eukprot:scaffold44005_cov28-Tisochrysis_lutea.AAC.1
MAMGDGIPTWQLSTSTSTPAIRDTVAQQLQLRTADAIAAGASTSLQPRRGGPGLILVSRRRHMHMFSIVGGRVVPPVASSLTI